MPTSTISGMWLDLWFPYIINQDSGVLVFGFDFIITNNNNANIYMEQRKLIAPTRDYLSQFHH